MHQQPDREVPSLALQLRLPDDAIATLSALAVAASLHVKLHLALFQPSVQIIQSESINRHQISHSTKIEMAADLAARHLPDFWGNLAPQGDSNQQSK